jgi:Tfp pilus assembly protein PilO
VSRRIKLLLIGLGVVVVAVLVFFLLIKPVMDDIGEINGQIDQTQSEIDALRGEVARAESTKAEARRNQARLLELAKMIPPTAELPSLIVQIQDLADKAGIDWIQITPSEARDSGTGSYQIVQLSLQFEGTYYNVSDFLWRTERMAGGPGRLLATKSLSLRLAPEEEGTTGSVTAGTGLVADITLFAFVMQPIAQAPATEGTEATGTTTDTGTTQ